MTSASSSSTHGGRLRAPLSSCLASLQRSLRCMASLLTTWPSQSSMARSLFADMESSTIRSSIYSSQGMLLSPPTSPPSCFHLSSFVSFFLKWGHISSFIKKYLFTPADCPLHIFFTRCQHLFINSLIIFFSSALTTIKFWEDSSSVSNTQLAKTFGYSTDDINTMESRFLKGLDFSLFVNFERIHQFMFANGERMKKEQSITTVPSFNQKDNYFPQPDPMRVGC